MNTIYETPQSADLHRGGQRAQKPGAILITLTVLLTVLAFSASFLNQFLATGLVAGGVGGGLAPLLVGGIVVGLFQIGKRFRNSRSRCKIFLWCQVFFFISIVIGMLGQLVQVVK